jgi:hypothetical protein
VQIWFLAQRLNKRKKKYLSQNRIRAQRANEVWQMDATAFDIRGQEIIRHLSKEVTREQILVFEISHRKPAQVENKANLNVCLLWE